MMTSAENITRSVRQSLWMIPVITDLLKFEYEIYLRDEPQNRLRLEITHRAFWDDIIADDISKACNHFYLLTNEYTSLSMDHMIIDLIDTTIMDNLSEMILARSKTQKSRSRAEIKQLLRSAEIKGEVIGWWKNHH
jgi:hypothetical protein